jgi:transcriptional regulator with XRE-family HTH domain
MQLDDINVIVAENLKLIREKRKLSLEKVAEATGVSKSMLGQIERGESNPTIQTLWRIAKGLRISFTSLIEQKPTETILVKKDQISPILGDRGRFRIYPVFAFDEEKRFEILDIELDPEAYSVSEPHEAGTEEYVLVHQGELTLELEKEEYRIGKGDCIKYPGSQPHSYRNLSGETTKISMVIYYPNR